MNADFDLFKKLVYTHTTVMRDVDKSLAEGNPPAPAGGPPRGGNRQPPAAADGKFQSHPRGGIAVEGNL